MELIFIYGRIPATQQRTRHRSRPHKFEHSLVSSCITAQTHAAPRRKNVFRIDLRPRPYGRAGSTTPMLARFLLRTIWPPTATLGPPNVRRYDKLRTIGGVTMILASRIVPQRDELIDDRACLRHVARYAMPCVRRNLYCNATCQIGDAQRATARCPGGLVD